MSGKLAAIGAGAWGKNIVRTLREMDRLAVVAEASPVLRAQLAHDYPDLEVVADYRTLLERTDIVGITIATPVPTHYEIALDCLQSGKDVFVEKPLTLTLISAEHLQQVAVEDARILMVGHLLLYKPCVNFLRQYLVEGHLGKIFTYHQERMKLGKARAVENALWSLGVHDIAALLFLAGESPKSVECSMHSGLQVGIEDDVYLHMTFADGRVAHLHNSWLWPEDRRGLRIIGERGMIVYDEKSETVSLVKKYVDTALNHHDDGTEVLFQDPGSQALRLELEHFVDCIATRQEPRSGGLNGVEVIRVLEDACYPIPF
jgi:predicted dehydrogenase